MWHMWLLEFNYSFIHENSKEVGKQTVASYYEVHSEEFENQTVSNIVRHPMSSNNWAPFIIGVQVRFARMPRYSRSW